MVEICETCGEKGFFKALIYCTDCWDAAQHIYCLGLSPDDITKVFSWSCDTCAKKDKRLLKMVTFGDRLEGKNKVSGPSPGHSASGMPVVGPIWRGGLEIRGSFNGNLDDLEAFMPKTSYSEVVKVLQGIQSTVCFTMKDRSKLWPKKFDKVGAASCHIELFIFPTFSSETDYDNLVEFMIANDLAMASDIGDFELIVFTSLEQLAVTRKKIKGKYYLWGMLKDNDFHNNKGYKSKKQIPAWGMSTCLGAEGSLTNADFSPCVPSLEKIGSGYAKVREGKGTTVKNSFEKCKDPPGLPKIKISLGAGSKHGTKSLKLTKILSLVNNDLVTGPVCKGPRSKRRRISSSSMKEGHAFRTVIEGISGIDPLNANKAACLKQRLDTPCCAKTSTIEPSIEDTLHVIECVPDATPEIQTPETATFREHDNSATDKLDAVTLGHEDSGGPNISLIDGCDTYIKQRSYDADDKSNYRDFEEPLSLLVESPNSITSNLVLPLSQSRAILFEDDNMDISDSPDMSSSIFDAPSHVVGISSDKLGTQAFECKSMSHMPSALHSINENGEPAQNHVGDQPKEAEQPCCESDMEIDEPNDPLGFTRREENIDLSISSSVNCFDGDEDGLKSPTHVDALQSVASITMNLVVEQPEQQSQCGNVAQATDLEEAICLSPLLEVAQHLKNKEENVPGLNSPAPVQVHCEMYAMSTSVEKLESPVRVPCLAQDQEINSRSDDELAKVVFNVLAHVNMAYCTTLGEKQTLPGLNQVAPVENQYDHAILHPTVELEIVPGCQTSNLSDNGSCGTLVLDFEEEIGGSSTSIAATCVLDLEEEISTGGIRNIEDMTDMVTSTLKLAADYRETSSDMVLTQIGRYSIDADLAPILTKILDKYGDIALGCFVEPQDQLRKICMTIQDLESICTRDLRRHHVDRLRKLCRLADALGVDVQWLSKRCEDLEKFAIDTSEYPCQKNELTQCDEANQSREEELNLKRAALAKLQEEIKLMEAEFESVKQHEKKLHHEIETLMFKSSRFLEKSLAEGLS